MSPLFLSQTPCTMLHLSACCKYKEGLVLHVVNNQQTPVHLHQSGVAPRLIPGFFPPETDLSLWSVTLFTWWAQVMEQLMQNEFFLLLHSRHPRSFIFVYGLQIRLKKSNINCIDRIAGAPWTGTDTCTVVSHVDNRAYCCFPGHWIHMHLHCPKYLRVASVIWATMNWRDTLPHVGQRGPFLPATLSADLHRGHTWIVQWLFYANHHSRCVICCVGVGMNLTES